MMQWQLYRKRENRIYMKTSGVPAIFWNDGAGNRDTVLNAEICKDAETILGYTCDELILTCKTGVQRYYFSREIKLDPKLFAQHKFGNFSEVVSRTRSIPLKIMIETPQFSLMNTAAQIVPAQLEEKEFEPPEGSQLQKVRIDYYIPFMRATLSNAITLIPSVIFPSITICNASFSGSFHTLRSASVSSSEFLPSSRSSARKI